jgi:hypothetical protein
MNKAGCVQEQYCNPDWIFEEFVMSRRKTAELKGE